MGTIRSEIGYYSNLLGDRGDCESLNNWAAGFSSKVLDPTNYVFSNNGLKITALADTSEHYADISPLLPVTSGNYYFVSCYLKPLVGRCKLRLVSGTDVSSNIITDTTQFTRVGVKIKSSAATLRIRPQLINSSNISVFAGTNESMVFDGVLVLDISVFDYSLSISDLLNKYSFINNSKYIKNNNFTTIL